MYFYYKSIIFEFEFNTSYNKIIITNNKITKCDNNNIMNDIKNKIDKIQHNIVYVEFYVSLYDYNIIEKDKYWETIKNLDINNLPIYKKNNDLFEYLQWLQKNFNNNEIRIYETSKFTKRKTNFNSNEIDKCIQSVKYENTNLKFNNFNQIFYHAGDYDDIERFGYLYIRTLFGIEKNIKISKENIYNKDNDKLFIWDKFNTDFDSIKNTMYYMFKQMKKGILVGIKNNKLAIFLPFSNYDYKNDFFTELYFDENDKKNLLEYKKNPDNEYIKKKLENTLKYYLNKYKLNSKNILFDRKKWVANDCFFRYENYEGDKSEALFEDFLTELCANRELPDCIFFLNLRDHPMLNINLKNSYTSIIDKKLDDEFIFKKYAPILSQGGSIYTSDICICTQDDWLRVSKKIYPDDCKNGYLHDVIIDWEKKINKAVFRGSATGCGITSKDNIRIKAVELSKKNYEYLDAGIVSFNRKLKKNINKPLEIIDIDIKLEKSNFMSLEEKAKYKYILNLDGHVSAFRLGHEFSLGSVLLIPKSKYYLWFSYLLEPWVHYVPIDENLDNLIDQIKWCIDNDLKCKKIAENGLNFYKKYLEKDGIFDYMQNILNKIALKPLGLINHKKSNSKSESKSESESESESESNSKSESIAIITIYRNKSDNQRLQQKRLFLYWMNKMLSQICNYDIIVVEQSEKYLFNIGKLKNIGFDYLNKFSKKKYSNYIFSDIDTLPDSDLIEYFFKITNSINSLAKYGTRYDNYYKSNKPFAGALLSCSKNVFEELNGYPNNFYGWQGEDTNLLLRLYGINKPIYYNTIGKIIDIEEINGYKKNIKTKLSELDINNEREKQMYEKNIHWTNFKSNGLTNLNYTILYENNFVYNDATNYHIIVDLEYDNDIKKYKSDYEFTENYNKNDYTKLLLETIDKIKQIKLINNISYSELSRQNNNILDKITCQIKLTNNLAEFNTENRIVDIINIDGNDIVIKKEMIIDDIELKEYNFYKNYMEKIKKSNFDNFILFPIKILDCSNSKIYLFQKLDFDYNSNFISKTLFNMWKNYTLELCLTLYYLNNIIGIYHNDLCYKNDLRNIMIKNNNELIKININDFNYETSQQHIVFIDFGWSSKKPEHNTFKFFYNKYKKKSKEYKFISEVFLVYYISYKLYFKIDDYWNEKYDEIYNVFELKSNNLKEFDTFIIKSLLELNNELI